MRIFSSIRYLHFESKIKIFYLYEKRFQNDSELTLVGNNLIFELFLLNKFSKALVSSNILARARFGSLPYVVVK